LVFSNQNTPCVSRSTTPRHSLVTLHGIGPPQPVGSSSGSISKASGAKLCVYTFLLHVNNLWLCVSATNQNGFVKACGLPNKLFQMRST